MPLVTLNAFSEYVRYVSDRSWSVLSKVCVKSFLVRQATAIRIFPPNPIQRCITIQVLRAT